MIVQAQTDAARVPFTNERTSAAVVFGMTVVAGGRWRLSV